MAPDGSELKTPMCLFIYLKLSIFPSFCLLKKLNWNLEIRYRDMKVYFREKLMFLFWNILFSKWRLDAAG